MRICAVFVWDCMRKMKIQAEHGYSAPVVGGFTRTVSFQTAVLQPNYALFVEHTHSQNYTHKNFSIVWVKGYQLHKVQ